MCHTSEIQIRFPTKVTDKIRQTIGFPWDDLKDVDGVSYGVIYKAEQYVMNEFKALAKELVPFIARYDRELLASYGGLLIICKSDDKGHPVAAVYEDGEVDEQELQNIFNYYALKRIVIKEWSHDNC